MCKLFIPSVSMDILFNLILTPYRRFVGQLYLPNSQGRLSCRLWQCTLKRGFDPLLLLGVQG